MKKASKILTLILVFVLLAGVFAGCAMFGRNSTKYRALVAVTVGNEEITVGKILDTFNNYYNTYGSYIGQGITVEYLMQMTMQSLVSQAMKVDAYVNDATSQKYDHEFKGICRNAEYLTPEEMEFCIRYVKYLTFQSFDSSVLSRITGDRTIGEEKKDDTSRDFTKLDDLGDSTTYSEYTYKQRVFNEDADEYFDKYFKNVDIKTAANVDEYVYQSADAAADMLANLNDRLDEEDEKITYAEYKAAQEKVVKQYERSIKNTYSVSLNEFIVNQIADMVASTIAAKYDYSVNKVIDTTNLQATFDVLKNNLAADRASQKTGFGLNDNFVSFIEGLSSSSYIYDVPEEYARVSNGEEQKGYIFVKNILIPFTDQQKTTLSNLAADLGGDTTHETYIALRNAYAAKVVADDFDNPIEGEDGKYEQVEGIFKIDEATNELIINPNGELGILFQDGNVVIEGTDYKTKDEAVIAMMKRFNTDTAQHTAQYDYVVRVGDVPAGYTHNWVTEFVDAANVTAKKGVGSYALAISTYGVHIVYYSADVEAYNFNFEENYLNTATAEYRLFNAYFTSQASRLVNNAVEDLTKSYLDNDKIVVTKNFKKFLKDNEMEFDLIKFLKDED